LDSTGNHAINFSYGKRIERPYFQDLNPFIRPFDKFTFYTGNPDLLPTYSHNLTLGYSYKQYLNLSVNYYKAIDEINEALEIVNQIYFSKPKNISNSTVINLSIESTIPITKWFDVNVYTEIGNRAYQSQLFTEILNTGGDYMAGNIINNFKLGKGWNGELRGNFQTDIIVAQLTAQGFYMINAAVSKKILKDKGSLKLSLNDILYTRVANGVINNLRLTDADWNSRLDTRNASITFSYRFGKPIGSKQKYKSTGSETEQNRVKT
jgi:hypothetical protein